MLLFLLEINNTKQIQYYILILTRSKLLVRIENHIYFLVFENTVAELSPAHEMDAN